MNKSETLRADRLKKLELLQAAGMEAFPARISREHTIADILASFPNHEEKKDTLSIAGRVMSLRGHGAIMFADIFDGTGRMQAVIQKGELSDEALELFVAVVDQGDFIAVSGTALTTKRGEQSLQVATWTMGAKSLMPLPSEWYGLKDEEARYRERYVDLLLTPTLRDMFIKKAKFWQATRNFLVQEGFLEVETPVLENTTGGADARPFVTHHNALDIDVFLRISAGELWQKRLMVAGFPKVFEIGRIFRNEGMSNEHLQDYTQLEFYWGYADFNKGMDLVERLYKYIAQETFGTLKFTIGKFDVDLGAPWERYDYAETIKKYTAIDIWNADVPTIEAKLKELKVEWSKDGWNKSRAIDTLWKYCRKQIGGPGFLVNVPKFLSPLAKSNPGNIFVVEQFQPLIAGSELGKGYSELNDPIDQKERFEEQAKLREAGDDEAQMTDDEFVQALEYGMPPTCGFGMSERVFAFLANTSVREAQLFPLLRPKE